MAFVPLKEVPVTDFKSAVIANSETVAVGDALIPAATGHTKFVLGAASTTGRILGVCMAILGLNGKVTELQSIAAGASNETNKTYSVLYIPSHLPVEYLADLSAAVDTTTDSGGLVSFNLNATNNTLDETSVALFSATQKQFVSYGNPDFPGIANTKVVGHWAQSLTI